MINEKGKKELGKKDIKILEGILAKSPEALGEGDKEHLTARRSYLTKETLKEYEIKETGETKTEEPAPETATPTSPETEEDGGEDPADDTTDYDGMNKDKLKEECKKRNIEVAARETKDGLIGLLEADDRGELEDDEE